MANTATSPKASPLGKGYEVTLRRSFDAPVALVFDCFTDPAHFAKWWGPRESANVIHTLDARPGGEISLLMSGPGFSHTMGGEFVEIDRPRRIVFRTKAFEAPDGGWGIVNYNTVTFEEKDGRTMMVLHTLVEKAAGEIVLGALGGMKAGWGESLERLGDLVGGGGRMDLEIGDRVIVLRRAFDAPRERVWDALTQPEAFAKWWLAGGGVVEAMDVRPGGEWRLRQTTPDGSSHLFWGEYRVVEPPARLVMTQGFDAHAPIEVAHDLAEEWGRTVLTRTMTFPNNDYRDGVLGSGLERGAADSYDALAKVLAG